MGRSLHRSDRAEDSGKSRGGGLCIYVNEDWCTNSTFIDKHCSPDLELLVVKCRPFYLPREFTGAVITAVYIPPDANANLALGHVLAAIDKQQNNYPEGVFIVAGDFNHADLKTVVPNLISMSSVQREGIIYWTVYTLILKRDTEPSPLHTWVNLITCHYP